MKTVQTIKKVLTEFNKNKVKYCILRNYEFLTDKKQKPGLDLDISIAIEDKSKAEQILSKYNFIKKPKQFSRKHQGYSYFSKEELLKLGFDVQWNGVVWNDMYYLNSSIYNRRKKVAYFYVLSDEDAFIMYLCHSILGKRFFKQKYRQKLLGLSNKDLDFNYITNHLNKTFKNRSIGKKLVYLVKNNQFDRILNIKNRLITKFIFPNHTFHFISLFFRWFNEKILTKKQPLIAIIGPDGAGKSTAVQNITKILQQNNRKVAQIYLGRGKSHLLPINKTGKAVYERIKTNQSKSLVKTIYYLAAPIYTLDLLLRYLFIVRPKRKNNIIVTDRYATDIYLMPKISNNFRLFLFSLFPKPTLTFYLFNDPNTLYNRKKQQSVEELKQQLAFFDKIAKRLNAIKIKTDKKEQVTAEISEKIFNYLAKTQF